MTTILTVGRADFRQRTRTFGTVVIIAAALQLGYLFVPDASAPRPRPVLRAAHEYRMQDRETAH